MKINMKQHYVTFKVKYPIDIEEFKGLSIEETKAKILSNFKYALDVDMTLFKDEVKLHQKVIEALNNQ